LIVRLTVDNCSSTYHPEAVDELELVLLDSSLSVSLLLQVPALLLPPSLLLLLVPLSEFCCWRRWSVGLVVEGADSSFFSSSLLSAFFLAGALGFGARFGRGCCGVSDGARSLCLSGTCEVGLAVSCDFVQTLSASACSTSSTRPLLLRAFGLDFAIAARVMQSTSKSEADFGKESKSSSVGQLLGRASLNIGSMRI
jgi:hypothetical protein